MRKTSTTSHRKSSELVALKEFVRELKAENLRLQKQVAKEKVKRVTAENRAKLFETYRKEGIEGLTNAELEAIIKSGRKLEPKARA